MVQQRREQIRRQATVLVGELAKRGWKITAAESCTGGLISAAITAVSGSSAVFDGSVICYANEIKSSILGVKEETLTTKGAVSPDCVLEMAQGAAGLFSSNLAIAVSGIAGPGGGTPQKPVGTVFICLAKKEGDRFSTSVVENHFDGDRDDIREQTVLKALRLANTAFSGEIYDEIACSSFGGNEEAVSLKSEASFERSLSEFEEMAVHFEESMGIFEDPVGLYPLFSEQQGAFEEGGLLFEEEAKP